MSFRTKMKSLWRDLGKIRNGLFMILLFAAWLGCANREQGSQMPAQVYVGREVHAPGAYAWTNGMRLTDAIAAAGGLTDFAKRSRIRVSHVAGTRDVFDYDRALGRTDNNPLLRPGDRVYVSSPFLY